jgi:glucosylglycerate synthase
MTTIARRRGLPRLPEFLGAKIHDAKDPGSDLAAMLVQVVSAVFDLMGTYRERWAAVEGAEEVPLFGFPHGVGLEPVSVNVGAHAGDLRAGRPRPRRGLGPGARARHPGEVAALAAADERGFRFPDPLWVRIVHDFAIAYHRRALPREQLLRSLVPLYLGRTASFVLATADERLRGGRGGDPGPRRRVRAPEGRPARALAVRRVREMGEVLRIDAE